MLENWEFQQPYFLILLALLPILIYYEFGVKNKKKLAMKAPTIKAFNTQPTTLHRLKPILFWLRIATLTLMIVAFARPREVNVGIEYNSEKGVDIFMVVDTSLSMLAKDLKPNRLASLKNVVTDFADNRLNDRIGLVEYSGEAITRVPLTTDRNILVEETQKLESGSLHQGTAIGIGLATAVNHLKESTAKSKIIILITDGVESIDQNANLMYVPPLEAAEIAKELGIKVYTIGIGTNGFALSPYGTDMFGRINFKYIPVEIDEELLENIASETDGTYFRATDNQSLKQIYDEIDRLEKTEINKIKYYSYKEKFSKYLMFGFALLLLELLLRATVYREYV